MTNKAKLRLYMGVSLLVVLLAFGIGLLYSRGWANGLVLKPIHRLPTTDRVVALTFDDGPSRIRTPLLLALLNRHGVKATFFMMGRNVEAYPGIAASVHEEGHLIGSHSYSHQHMIFRSPSFIRTEIDKTNDLIAGVGQNQVEFFRPPYCSKYLLLPVMLKEKGTHLVTGTYDPPAQYRTPYSAVLVASQVVSNARPGSIVFLHDGVDTYPDAFVESVDLIVKGLADLGYSFVTVDYGAR